MLSNDNFSWEFASEGGGHVIFRSKGGDVMKHQNIVVRNPMIRASKRGYIETYEDALEKTSLREFSPRQFRVKVSRDVLIQLDKILAASERRREPKRRDDRLNIEIEHVVVMSDLTKSSDSTTEASWCVEIKPKCGVLPSSPFVTRWIKQKKSRFWLHQRLKLHQGKIERISEYEPLDLFNDNDRDISKSLHRLVRTPQNNFRVFRDGKFIESTEVDLKTLDMASKILKSSRVLSKLRHELETRNRFDIEMVVGMYEFCRSNLKSPKIFEAALLGGKGGGGIEDDVDDIKEIWKRSAHIYNRTRDLSVRVTVREAMDVIRNYLIWKTLCDVSILCTFSEKTQEITIIDSDMKSHKKIPYYFAMDEEITIFNQRRNLHLANAHEIVRMLRAKEIDSKHLLEIVQSRHASQDPKVHSTPTTCFERAKEFIASKQFSDQTVLCGCPILIKDLDDVKGVRTTYGCTLYANHIPLKSDPMVCLLEKRGAVVVGKTNTPEFGAGSQTFNRLFPSTRSPHDTRTTAGGSSGGSASALATHQCWLASGSDLGGSLRIPAAMCGVVGFRVSPGLIPRDDEDGKSGPRHNLHGVNGPMGRVVRDVALFLDAMTTPLKRRTDGWEFDSMSQKDNEVPKILLANDHYVTTRNFFESISIRAKIKASLLRAKEHPSCSRFVVGFSVLNCPCDPQIERCCREAAQIFVRDLRHLNEAKTVSLESRVRFDDKTAWRLFKSLRAEKFRVSFEKLIQDPETRYVLKPEVVWNTEVAKRTYLNDLKDSKRFLGEIERLFRDDIDLLFVPATSCLSFDVDVRYPNTIAGSRCENYLDWMRIACVVSSMGCPSIVIPCGTSPDGRTIGIQIVAPPGKDATAIAAASFLEVSLHRELSSVRSIRAGYSVPRTGTFDLSAGVDGPRTREDAGKHHGLMDWKDF